MEATHIYVACALASAFGLAFVGGRSAYKLIAGGSTAHKNGVYQRGSWRWYLRNGVGITRILAKRLLGISVIASLVDEGVVACKMAQVDTTQTSLLSIFLAGVLLCASVVGLVTTSVVSAIAVSACVIVLCILWLNAKRDERAEATREALPEVFRSMEICFQSGFTLLQTFKQISQETSGSLHYLFDRAARRLELGQSADSALAVFREDASIPGLSFVSVALDVQHQAGGSITEVLESARLALKDELHLRRSLQVQTAQAKLSARVVTVLPFVLIALFSLISDGFLDPFFESPLGWMLLGVAFAMQFGGILMVRRMLAVEVSVS